jgi:hypothetical protein
MKCPHCFVAIFAAPENINIGEDPDGKWTLTSTTCPSCRKLILSLNRYQAEQGHGAVKNPPTSQYGSFPASANYRPAQYETTMIRPRGSRPPVSADVPQEVACDYREAAQVLAVSAKASAAMSRRCLQNLLRTAAGVKAGDLANEIQQVLDSRSLPSQLAEALDAVRNIGNFAAHPIKSKGTGEIVDVESGEAEWQLEVLDGLFDFYYVQPSILKAKKEALNKKLQDAGKPPMK